MARSVLVVEDDDDIREALHELLAQEGFAVHTARDGQEGLEVLARLAPPCVVLLDMMMPRMDGAAFLRERARSAALTAIPVVVMSAAARPPLAGEHVADFLKKPYELEQLLSRLRELCPPEGA
jgi:CheY-like chemotaxis protein